MDPETYQLVVDPRVDDGTEVDVLMWPGSGGLTIVLENNVG